MGSNFELGIEMDEKKLLTSFGDVSGTTSERKRISFLSAVLVSFPVCQARCPLCHHSEVQSYLRALVEEQGRICHQHPRS